MFELVIGAITWGAITWGAITPPSLPSPSGIGINYRKQESAVQLAWGSKQAAFALQFTMSTD
jgi:hypothetical protein